MINSSKSRSKVLGEHLAGLDQSEVRGGRFPPRNDVGSEIYTSNTNWQGKTEERRAPDRNEGSEAKHLTLSEPQSPYL